MYSLEEDHNFSLHRLPLSLGSLPPPPAVALGSGEPNGLERAIPKPAPGSSAFPPQKLGRQRARFQARAVRLCYRLAHIGVRLPALRERPEDVLDLAEKLLARERKGLVLAEDARAALRIHPFPGNIRELGNAMKRAAALVDADGVVHADDLQLDPIAGSEAQASEVKQGSDARAFTYPAGVIDLAWRALTTGEVPRPDGLTRRGARAFVRAAFVHLKCEQCRACRREDGWWRASDFSRGPGGRPRSRYRAPRRP